MKLPRFFYLRSSYSEIHNPFTIFLRFKSHLHREFRVARSVSASLFREPFVLTNRAVGL